jgi:hypothetical protein
MLRTDCSAAADIACTGMRVSCRLRLQRRLRTGSNAVAGPALFGMHDSTCGQLDDQVCVGDRVEPMRDHHDCDIAQLAADRSLNQTIRVDVDTGRGFVQHDDACASEDGSRHAQQLPLALREVVTVLHDGCVERTGHRSNHGVEVHASQRRPDDVVADGGEAIDVRTHAAGK